MKHTSNAAIPAEARECLPKHMREMSLLEIIEYCDKMQERVRELSASYSSAADKNKSSSLTRSARVKS